MSARWTGAFEKQPLNERPLSGRLSEAIDWKLTEALFDQPVILVVGGLVPAGVAAIGFWRTGQTWYRARGKRADRARRAGGRARRFCPPAHRSGPNGTLAALVLFGGSHKRRRVRLVEHRAARRCSAVGLTGDFAGHSLRSGFVTTAAGNGVDALEISNQTRHKSLDMVRRYARPATIWKSNAAFRVGM